MKTTKSLTSSSNNSNAQCQKKVHRPLNCFMTFRLEKQNGIMEKFPNANHRDISKIIAKWWKELPEEEKEPYKKKAELAKQEHMKLYPDYKYKPTKKTTKPRAYRMRPESCFTREDIEAKRQLLSLANNKSISNDDDSSSSNGDNSSAMDIIGGNKLATIGGVHSVLNQSVVDDDGQDIICCAPCLSSNKSCFTTDHDKSLLIAAAISSNIDHTNQIEMYSDKGDGFPSVSPTLNFAAGGTVHGNMHENNIYDPFSTIFSPENLSAAISAASQTDNSSPTLSAEPASLLEKTWESESSSSSPQSRARSPSPPSTIIDKQENDNDRPLVPSSDNFPF